MNGTRDPGARWIRCDLHVHTPMDAERTFGENVKHAIEAFKKERLERLAEIATNLIEACRKGAGGDGIELVALTDHNSIDGYRYLNPQFETIAQQARDEGLLMPIVLPGVEFSVGGERPLHFLVIFSSDTNPDDIAGAISHVFGENEPFDPTTGTPRATGTSINEFLTKLYEYCLPPAGDRELSFVIIPAHADGSRGIISETSGDVLAVATTLWDEMKGHLRQRAVTRRDWHAFQTLRPYEELPEAFRDLLARWIVARRQLDWDSLSARERAEIKSRTHWPLIECSDPHAYEDMGSRFTWLKMEVPDVEGIRLALLDPESRLRRMAAGIPGQNYPSLRRISIRNTDFFDSYEVSFNPSLNTIIGGRGSGKSTILECIRYALDRARTADFDEDEADIFEAVESLLSAKDERDFGQTPGILLPDYKIEVDLTIAGRTYQVGRSADGTRVVPEPEDDAAPIDIRSLINPRILSQRQIARIARNPAAQRRELDALSDPEFLREFVAKRREILADINEAQVRSHSLAGQAADLPSRETALRTINDQIEFLERGGQEEILQSYRAYQSEDVWIGRVLRIVGDVGDRLTEEASSVTADLDRISEAPDGPNADWLAEVYERTRNTLTEVDRSLADRAKDMTELQKAIGSEKAEKWLPEFEQARDAYRGISKEMEEKGVEFGQHDVLMRKKSEVEEEIIQLRELPPRIEELEERINGLRSSLVRLHEERITVRRELAKALEEEDADVRLEVVAFGDRDDLFSQREEWFAGAGLQRRDWEVLIEYVFSPDGAVPDRLLRLVSAIRQDVQATDLAGRAITRDDSKSATLLGDLGDQLTLNFFNALQRGHRIRLDEMFRFLPEDRVEARVRGRDNQFKPIEQGSIGERSTAILALLLAAGNQPLIIDQPEDDLDNQYVYDVVVELLRKRKFSRQMIIATHNPNIPVNGDAEQIIALEVQDGLGRTFEAGSIDRLAVKEIVAEIMEGSVEAFRLRRERYGY